MGLLLGKSLILFAAKSYFPKLSMSRFRTFDASASWMCDGGLSGSWSAIKSRWKLGRSNRMPFSNWIRVS